MVYRRFSQNFRRYPHSNMYPIPSVSANSGTIKVIDQIPLPNEAEKVSNPLNNSRPGQTPSFLDSIARILPLDAITKHIQLDEIILIGLIILLFVEGMQDDILIILLVYILIAGRD